MTTESHNYIFGLIEPIIQKQNTQLGEAIPANIRLTITLRYFASDETQQSLSLSYLIGRTTV